MKKLLIATLLLVTLLVTNSFATNPLEKDPTDPGSTWVGSPPAGMSAMSAAISSSDPYFKVSDEIVLDNCGTVAEPSNYGNVVAYNVQIDGDWKVRVIDYTDPSNLQTTTIGDGLYAMMSTNGKAYYHAKLGSYTTFNIFSADPATAQVEEVIIDESVDDVFANMNNCFLSFVETSTYTVKTAYMSDLIMFYPLSGTGKTQTMPSSNKIGQQVYSTWYQSSTSLWDIAIWREGIGASTLLSGTYHYMYPLAAGDMVVCARFTSNWSDCDVYLKSLDGSVSKVLAGGTGYQIPYDALKVGENILITYADYASGDADLKAKLIDSEGNVLTTLTIAGSSDHEYGGVATFMDGMSRIAICYVVEGTSTKNLKMRFLDLRTDINEDGIVNLGDFAEISANWLSNDCADPNWCGYTDLDKDGSVDANDLIIFSEEWLTLAEQKSSCCCEPMPDPNLVYNLIDQNDQGEIWVDVNDIVTLYLTSTVTATESEVMSITGEIQISDPNLGSIDNASSNDPNATAEILISNEFISEFGPGVDQEEGLYFITTSFGTSITGDVISFQYTATDVGDVELSFTDWGSSYLVGGEALPTTNSIIIHQGTQQMMMGGESMLYSASAIETEVSSTQVLSLIEAVEDILENTPNKDKETIENINLILGFLKEEL